MNCPGQQSVGCDQVVITRITTANSQPTQNILQIPFAMHEPSVAPIRLPMVNKSV